MADSRAPLTAAPAPPTALPTAPVIDVTADRLSCAFTSETAHLSAVRRAVEAFCRSTELGDAACDELGLVVNEALANVIRHAYAGAAGRPIEVTVYREGRGVRIAIRDWGIGRVPKATDNPAAADPLQPGGLGLICLRRLTDHTTFEPQPGGGMKLVLVRTTPGPSSDAPR